MLVGAIVMLIGCLCLIEKKEIAWLTGSAARSGEMSTSGVEDFVGILGVLLVTFGFGGFIFF